MSLLVMAMMEVDCLRMAMIYNDRMFVQMRMWLACKYSWLATVQVFVVKVFVFVPSWIVYAIAIAQLRRNSDLDDC